MNKEIEKALSNGIIESVKVTLDEMYFDFDDVKDIVEDEMINKVRVISKTMINGVLEERKGEIEVALNKSIDKLIESIEKDDTNASNLISAILLNKIR